MKKLIFWVIGALVIILLGTAFWIYGCAEQVREDAPEILKIVSRPLPLDSTDVSPSETLIVTLNFTIDHREITKDNLFAEYVEYGAAHTAGTPDLSFATLSWSSDSRTLTVSGIRGWSELVEYAGPKGVHIVAKADKFKDVFGNKLKASTVLWKYTLKQISAPTSSSTTSTSTTAPSLATSTSTTAPSLATSTSTTAPSLATTTTSFPTTTSATTTTTLSGRFDIEIVSDPNLDPFSAADLNSIGIDSNEYAHISYEDNNNSFLCYATNKTGSWQNETIDNSWNIGYENSIAVDINDNNKVHISYTDPFDSDNLLYAYGQAGSFSTEIIENDASWDLARYNSIAVEDNNNRVLHIAYLYNDGTDDQLKYASGGAGSWSLSTLESMGLVGTDISIALDSNNYPHISYGFHTGASDYDLKYTYKDGSGWHTSTVADTDDVGRTNSIAVDSNNYPHISYYDAAGEDLEYAYKDAEGWHYETVASDGDVGSYNSIAVDNNDYVNISCFKDASPDLLLWSTNRSGSWVTRTITNEVFRYNSIAVGSDNRVHISFSDGNGYLYYAEEQ